MKRVFQIFSGKIQNWFELQLRNAPMSIVPTVPAEFMKVGSKADNCADYTGFSRMNE